jgi:hypothetical protein
MTDKFLLPLRAGDVDSLAGAQVRELHKSIIYIMSLIKWKSYNGLTLGIDCGPISEFVHGKK